RHTRSKRDWSSDVCSSDLERCSTANRAARCLLLSIFRLLLYLRNVSILFQECGQPGGQLFHGAAAVADGVLFCVGEFGVAAAGEVGRASWREGGDGAVEEG